MHTRSVGFLSSMRELAMPHAPPARHADETPIAHQPTLVADDRRTPGAATIGAQGLGGGEDHSGPHLNTFWNRMFGGPNEHAGDGRPIDQNHIGTQEGWGPLDEGKQMSTAMRNTPYLGDYWQALSVTHDSARVNPPWLNAITGVTNVGLTGPVMGLMDAPFRAFGHSMFLDHVDDGHGPLTEPMNAVTNGASQAWDWTKNTASDAWNSVTDW